MNNAYLDNDKKNFEKEIKGTETISNIDVFVNYLSMSERFVKYDMSDHIDKINMSDINIWTLKRISDYLSID